MRDFGVKSEKCQNSVDVGIKPEKLLLEGSDRAALVDFRQHSGILDKRLLRIAYNAFENDRTSLK